MRILAGGDRYCLEQGVELVGADTLDAFAVLLQLGFEKRDHDRLLRAEQIVGRRDADAGKFCERAHRKTGGAGFLHE
jgi:hypothetical protein